LSLDRVVVLAGIFFGPAFLVSLVRTPAVRFAACFDFAALRPAPLLTCLRPGFSGVCRALPFGCVPVLFGALPRSLPSDIAVLLPMLLPMLLFDFLLQGRRLNPGRFENCNAFSVEWLSIDTAACGIFSIF
jgi:hypothetical protein